MYSLGVVIIISKGSRGHGSTLTPGIGCPYTRWAHHHQSHQCVKPSMKTQLILMPRRGLRHVANPFFSLPLSSLPSLQSDSMKLRAQALLTHLQECAAQKAVTTSTRHWNSRDFSIYTGLGGIALTLLRLGLHEGNDRVRGARAK